MKRTGREFVTKGIVSEADTEKVASRFVAVGKRAGGQCRGVSGASGLCVYVVYVRVCVLRRGNYFNLQLAEYIHFYFGTNFNKHTVLIDMHQDCRLEPNSQLPCVASIRTTR